MHRLALAALAALVSCPLPASAREVEGVAVPESVDIDGRRLVLNGSALREATILGIDVYVISLYLPARTRSVDAVLACDGPVHLTKRFVRDVDRSDMVPPWREATLARGKRIGADVSRPLEVLLGGLRDTRDGQTLGLTWHPEKGLRVTLDGRVTAEVSGVGPEFCKAVYTGYVGGMANEAKIASALMAGR